MIPPPSIRRLDTAAMQALAPQLAELFLDAVADGASVGFLAGLTPQQALAYWQDLAPQASQRAVLAGLDEEDGVAGVVMVVPAAAEVQPHRADIVKLVVHRRSRGRGLAAALMQAAEREALAMSRPHLTLMTRHGCDAERLYEKLGWTRVGVIPHDSLMPDGTPCDGSLFFKRLA
jgi:GNAT superfamily N-acetyltransferase